MVDSMPQRTCYRLCNQVPWRKFEFLDVLVPADLPSIPFCVFCPARTIQEVSNMRVGALRGELQRCRLAMDDPNTVDRAKEQVIILACTLRGAFDGLKDVGRRVRKMNRKAMRQARGEDTGETAAEEAEENDDGDGEVLQAPLNTLAQVEAFVRDPGISRIVSIAAVYLHLNRFQACRSLGTIEFLEDVQEMAFFEESWLTPWVPPTSHGLRFLDNGYCRAVRRDHALNARALLIALNFCYLDLLRMIPANIDDCSKWTESPQLALVTELILYPFRAERFPNAPLAKGDAELDNAVPSVLNFQRSAASPLEQATRPTARKTEQAETGQSRKDSIAGGDGKREERPSSSAVQELQANQPIMSTRVGQPVCGGPSASDSALDTANAIAGDTAPTQLPLPVAEANQQAAEDSAKVEIGKEGTAMTRKVKKKRKAKWNKGWTEATKQRQQEEQVPLAEVPPSDLELDIPIQVDDPINAEAPKEQQASAQAPAVSGQVKAPFTAVPPSKFELDVPIQLTTTTDTETPKEEQAPTPGPTAPEQVSDEEEQAPSAAFPVSDSETEIAIQVTAPVDTEACIQKPITKDEAMKQEKTKRKAKQQRRKERKRQEKEEKVEKKRPEEAKAERQRQEGRRTQEEVDQKIREVAQHIEKLMDVEKEIQENQALLGELGSKSDESSLCSCCRCCCAEDGHAEDGLDGQALYDRRNREIEQRKENQRRLEKEHREKQELFRKLNKQANEGPLTEAEERAADEYDQRCREIEKQLRLETEEILRLLDFQANEGQVAEAAERAKAYYDRLDAEAGERLSLASQLKEAQDHPAEEADPHRTRTLSLNVFGISSRSSSPAVLRTRATLDKPALLPKRAWSTSPRRAPAAPAVPVRETARPSQIKSTMPNGTQLPAQSKVKEIIPCRQPKVRNGKAVEGRHAEAGIAKKRKHKGSGKEQTQGAGQSPRIRPRTVACTAVGVPQFRGLRRTVVFPLFPGHLTKTSRPASQQGTATDQLEQANRVDLANKADCVSAGLDSGEDGGLSSSVDLATSKPRDDCNGSVCDTPSLTVNGDTFSDPKPTDSCGADAMGQPVHANEVHVTDQANNCGADGAGQPVPANGAHVGNEASTNEASANDCSAEEASRASGDEKIRDQQAELRRRQQEYLQRVEDVEGSSQRCFASNGAAAIPALPSGGNINDSNEEPLQSGRDSEDLEAQRVNETPHRVKGDSARQSGETSEECRQEVAQQPSGQSMMVPNQSVPACSALMFPGAAAQAMPVPGKLPLNADLAAQPPIHVEPTMGVGLTSKENNADKIRRLASQNRSGPRVNAQHQANGDSTSHAQGVLQAQRVTGTQRQVNRDSACQIRGSREGRRQWHSRRQGDEGSENGFENLPGQRVNGMPPHASISQTQENFRSQGGNGSQPQANGNSASHAREPNETFGRFPHQDQPYQELIDAAYVMSRTVEQTGRALDVVQRAFDGVVKEWGTLRHAQDRLLQARQAAQAHLQPVPILVQLSQQYEPPPEPWPEPVPEPQLESGQVSQPGVQSKGNAAQQSCELPSPPRQPFRPPLPWLSVPEHPFPRRTSRLRIELAPQQPVSRTRNSQASQPQGPQAGAEQDPAIAPSVTTVRLPSRLRGGNADELESRSGATSRTIGRSALPSPSASPITPDSVHPEQLPPTAAMPRPVEPATILDADGDALVHSYIDQFVRGYSVLDFEWLYNRVQNNLAHSRALSVDRGDFIVPFPGEYPSDPAVLVWVDPDGSSAEGRRTQRHFTMP
ncbi:hypothetical protein N657DRAFT_674268 [Parathielavia appendiculata]|uniref:Uncharacterized protein n=1 Tax=Parathielavia appendiculata TaxID=2587402 RepID=A0AAN6TUQ9_9PEZI|nr:hypothetical protein N657DRAFT_674268 [Parathielavia appendiculata]